MSLETKKIVSQLGESTSNELSLFDTIANCIQTHQKLIGNTHYELFSNFQKICQDALVRKENYKVRTSFFNEKTQQSTSKLDEITTQFEYFQDMVDEKEKIYKAVSNEVSELSKNIYDNKFNLISSEGELETLQKTYRDYDKEKDIILEKTVSLQKSYIESRSKLLSYQEKHDSLQKHYKDKIDKLKNYEESYEKASEEKKLYNLNLPILEQKNEVLFIEVEQLQKRMGKIYKEFYEEIVKTKKDVRCVICNELESGRMKKCVGCGVLAHSKCANELKFRCIACKD